MLTHINITDTKLLHLPPSQFFCIACTVHPVLTHYINSEFYLIISNVSNEPSESLTCLVKKFYLQYQNVSLIGFLELNMFSLSNINLIRRFSWTDSLTFWKGLEQLMLSSSIPIQFQPLRSMGWCSASGNCKIYKRVI